MNIQSSFDYFLKIIIIGDTGVGKSNFLNRFINGKFSQISQPTIGIDYKSKIIVLPKTKQNINLQFWDTAGQERYRSLNKLYFQRVQGIILMYDITKRESFEDLGSWTKLIFDNLDYIPIVLIGNKLDDADQNRIVREEEGKSFANENNFLFFETSALNGKNVNLAILSLCEKIISHLRGPTNFDINNSLSLNDIVEEKKIKKTERKEPCC